MDELIYASAARLANAIRTKQVSSYETVTAYLERIEAVNPKLNAVVQLTAETALEQARQADAGLARGEVKGPLHGLPLTLKDSLDTAGVISTGGTTGRARFIPDRDATVVARLRVAGAILLGKTNTPELTLAGETDNAVYGRTNNPYDLSRTPGGSSGGAAAIIAAGGSPLDLGSDTGGSIRIPAHFCGIAGIRPTSGRVPRTGHIISFDVGALDALTQIGPMARFVEDLVLTLPLIAGPDWRDPAIVPMPLGDPRAVELKHLRLCFYTSNQVAPPTPETVETVKTAVATLAEAGLVVEEKRPPGIEGASELWDRLYLADGGALVRKLLHRFGTVKMHSALDWSQKGKPLSLDEFNDLLIEWDMFRSAMLAFMEPYDLILCPAGPGPANLHGPVEDGTFSYVGAYNLTGWPGAVVRCGASPEGLPIGVQIIARPWREDVALAVAQHLETALGGWQRPML
jgi:amidase